MHHHCSLANCMGSWVADPCWAPASVFGGAWAPASVFGDLIGNQMQVRMQERGKHQCHKGEREQTACLQAFSSESAPTILFATNLSSRNQMIIFNLVDMIINAWLMNYVESLQCAPGVPAQGGGKSRDTFAHSAIDASGQNAEQAHLDKHCSIWELQSISI